MQVICCAKRCHAAVAVQLTTSCRYTGRIRCAARSPARSWSARRAARSSALCGCGVRCCSAKADIARGRSSLSTSLRISANGRSSLAPRVQAASWRVRAPAARCALPAAAGVVHPPGCGITRSWHVGWDSSSDQPLGGGQPRGKSACVAGERDIGQPVAPRHGGIPADSCYFGARSKDGTAAL